MTIFPSRIPFGLILGVLVGIALAPAIFLFWHSNLSTLESFYLWPYIKASATPEHTPVTGRVITNQYYMVTVNYVYATPETLPLDMKGVSGRFIQLRPAVYAAWLKLNIYHDRTPVEVFEFPLVAWMLLGSACLLTGSGFDFRRRQRAREGEQLRGPSTMTIDQFNRTTKVPRQERGFALRTKA
jgi:hypothetical protein